MNRSRPRTWTTAQLQAYVGGLSRPGKMPGHGYSIPAQECRVGGRLRQVEGSTCAVCYAYDRGRYGFPVVKSAQYRRLASITRPEWPAVMAELIRRTGDTHFRWHDAGDLQSVDHLRAIARVARLTPGVRHWLPSREYGIVRDYRAAGHRIPGNLTVRLSAHMVDGTAPRVGLPVSTVHTDTAPEGSYVCPAPHQGNSCGQCRACWDPRVKAVSYAAH